MDQYELVIDLFGDRQSNRPFLECKECKGSPDASGMVNHGQGCDYAGDQNCRLVVSNQAVSCLFAWARKYGDDSKPDGWPVSLRELRRRFPNTNL